MPLRADRVKALRKLRKLSQEELADRLHISQEQIARWESGKRNASADAVARLAEGLECTADWLLGLVEQPQQRLQPKDLAPDERRLIDLYRQGKLPPTILRMLTELPWTNAKEDLVVDGDGESGIASDEETLDS